MKIQFKQKLEDCGDYKCFKLPAKFNRRHIVKGTERGTTWDGYTNSNMLPSMIAYKVSALFGGSRLIRTDTLPAFVSIDDGFLATITIDLGADLR